MKNKKRKLYLGIGLLCLFLLGCTKEKVVIQSEGRLNNLAGEVSDRKEALEGKTASGEEAASVEGVFSAAGEAFKEGTVSKEEEASEEEALPGEQDVSQEEKACLWIHICGEVIHPGVYELPKGARIWDALQAAGGVTDEGEADYLNQASLLEDGMKITVPSHIQVEQWETDGETGIQNSGAATLVQSGQASQNSGSSKEDTKVNLNTADEALLCTLPGIGQSRARSIIAYREEKGPFSRIEDIMKVTGIKEAAFAKIKDYISVS